MPKEKLTLGIGLLMVGATLAPANYTVRKGDTLTGIAHKLHVSAPSLRIANGLGKKNTLRIGMKLVVPGKKATHSAKVAKTTPKKPVFHGGDTYTVRAGDNDWTIASRVGVSRKTLHNLNPKVAWTKIRPGTSLRLPKGKAAVAAAPRIRSRYAVVMKNGTSLRRAWSKNAPRVVTVLAHTRVAVLARKDSWYKVRSTGGSVGWVRGDLMKATSAPVTVASRKAVAKRVKATYVAIAKRRPSRAQRIAHWQKHMANVRARYVRVWSKQHRRYVVAPLTNGGDLVTRAEAYKGVRYRWGAASRSATDCSGFTSQVFKGEGVKLPRTSRQQATVGNKIDRNHLDKGDLVFFRTGRGHRITHVGMYVGGGKFIHASSGGGKVQVNKLSDRYYNNRFVTARRVPNKNTKKKAVAKKAEEPKPVEVTTPVEAPPAVVAEETPEQ